MTDCPHGIDRAALTRDGQPRCPFCRHGVGYRTDTVQHYRGPTYWRALLPPDEPPLFGEEPETAR
jgi:hypothetical protein